MKIIKEGQDLTKAVKDMFEEAKTNTSSNMSDYIYAYEEKSALVFFKVEKHELFRSPRLQTSYHVGLMFVQDGNILPFNQEKTDEMIRLIFGNDYEKVWQKAPEDSDSILSEMQQYDLFITIPYGYAAIYLEPEDMKELVKNNYALYT